MKNEPIMGWTADEGVAICTIEYDDKTFTGMACCHPEDMDMCSEKTGYYIAERRALIAVTQYYKKELKHKLAALRQLYYSINQSKYYNPKSYESRMLQRQINLLEEDLALISSQIKAYKEELHLYINAKAEFHTKIRENRQKGKSN